MAEENKDVEVDVSKEASPGDIKIETAEQKEISAEEGLEELRRKLESAETRAKEAESRAFTAETARHKASETVEEANLHIVVGAIENIRRDNEMLKANYRAAMSVSDFDGAVEFQEAISKNAADLRQLENGKQALETRQKVPPPVQRHSDPVEAFASQLSPRSAEWIRRNPQCVTDPRLHQKMIATHNLALADGYKADTDDYFAFVEGTLRVGSASQASAPSESALSEASAPAKRRSAPPAAAPVSRESNTRSTIVRLSEQEREMASMMKMTDQEYGKHKLALQKEGKLH